MRDAPAERAGSDAEVERSQPDRRARFVLPVLALLSVLFFAGALAYAVGGGFLGGGDEEGLSERSKRPLPRDWANMIPLQPVDPDLRPDSGTAGAREDFRSRSPADEDASGATGSGPRPAPALAAVGSSPPALSAVPRRVPVLRAPVRRVPALIDLTPARPSVPGLPGLGGSVPDIDLPGGGVDIPPILPGGVDIPPILPGGVDIPPILPGGVDMPPILPGGVDIPPILPGGVQIPPVGPVPGVPVVPPVNPLPGGGGPPLPGGGGGQPLPGGLPSPGGVLALGDGQGLSAARGVAPVLPLVSVASLSVDDEPASEGPATKRRAGQPVPREERSGTARAGSELRAARTPRVRKAPVKTPPAPTSDARAGGRGRDRAESDTRPPDTQGASKDCDPGRDREPSRRADPGCDETPAEAGSFSNRQPQREAPGRPSSDLAGRAEGEDGP